MTISLRAIRPKRFQLIDPIRTQVNVRRGIRRYLERVRDDLREGYDTVPEDYTKYKRTDELYYGFRIVIDANGQGGTLYNDAKDKRGRAYAVYVIGPKGGGRGIGERQSQLQRRRGWPSITDVARRNRPLFKQLMNRSISPHAGDVV